MPNQRRNPTTVNEFKQIANDFSYAKLFALSIPDFKGFGGSSFIPSKNTSGPGGAKDINGVASKLNAYARSFALPGAVKNPKQVTIQHGLPPINIVDSVTFAPWTVTFIDDSLLTIRKFFESWMGAIRRWEDHSYAVPIRYKANNSVASILNMDRHPIQSYEFFGMFPTDISPITVGQDNNNLIEFSVTFYYDFYRLIPVVEPSAVMAVEAPYAVDSRSDRQTDESGPNSGIDTSTIA